MTPKEENELDLIEMTSEEKQELSMLVVDAQIRLWNVLQANLEQGKITAEQESEAGLAISDTFPTQGQYERGEIQRRPVFSKNDLVSRLKQLGRKYPFLIGVYKKYAEQLDAPIYCISCGSELARSAQFCPDCGTEVTSPEGA